MVRRGITWILVVAFFSLIASPGRGVAETVPPTVAAPTANDTEDSSLEAGGSDNNAGTPVFSVRESLLFAQSEDTPDAAKGEAIVPPEAKPEPAAGTQPRPEGLSSGAVIGIVIVGVVLVALAVAAAAASGGSGGFSGVKFNIGR